MPEDPFVPILGGLGELLKIIEKNAHKPLKGGPVDPAIERQLAQAEEMVNRLADIVDEELKREGKSDKGVYGRIEKQPLQYSEADQRILKWCRDLGVNAVVLRVGLLRAIRESQHAKPREIGKNTRESIKKRRAKFKGTDSRQKWKKL